MKCFGDKLGTKISYPKDKKSKYKVYPLMFFRPIFFVPRKEKQSRSHHMMIFEAHCKYNKV